MKDNIPLHEKTIFTLGLFGQNMIYNFLQAYLLFFYTDILNISPVAAGVLFTVAKIWDAVNDPVMGAISDRTRTKIGKFRPYLIFAPPAIMLFTTLCFFNFKGTPTQTLVFAYVTYILWGMAYTVCDIPIWSLSSAMSNDPQQKTIAITLGKIAGLFGAAAITLFGIQIINLFGGERLPEAYTKSAAVIVVFSGILMVMVGLFTKERVVSTKERIPFMQNFKTIYSNKPLLLLAAVMLAVNFANGFRQTLMMHYCVYVMGDADYMTLLGASLIIGMFLGMIVTPFFTKRLPSKQVLIYSSIMTGIAGVFPYFVSYSNITLILILATFAFFFTGIQQIAIGAILIDTIDFAEWKFGFRSEGMIFSAQTFLVKLAGSVASFSIGLSLAAIGYIKDAVQTESVINNLHAMMFLYPSIIFVLSCLPMFFYKFDGKRRDAVISELRERKAKEL